MNYLYNFIGCQYTKNKDDLKSLKNKYATLMNESEDQLLNNELEDDIFP